jgi:O-antigen/teichoic acid export membrane protein
MKNNPVVDSTLAESALDMIGPRRWTFGFANFSRSTLWITKGSLAVIDQGLISGSNFLIGILLARWLLPAQYGAYSLAFEIFLMLSFFHQALLIEPQRVFGPSDYPDCLQEYLGVLLWLNAGLAVVVSVVLGISCLLFHALARPDNLSGALAGLTVAAPCILLLWLARSAYYVKISPQGAVAGSAVYCAIVLGSLLLLQRLKLMSPLFAFLVMGFAALISSTVLLIRLNPVLKLRTSRQMWRKVGAQHWEYGRWILASLGVSSLSGGIYYPLISGFSGLAAAGELKALLNFSLPVAQTLSALSVFLLPYASRVYRESGLASLRSLIWKITWLFGAAAISYWTCLILFSKPVLRSLYGGHYTELAHLIPWLAVGSLPWNLAAVPAVVLRAVRSPVSIFGAYCASCIVVLLVGVPAIWALGLRGALLAMILSNLASLVVVVTLLRRKLRNISIAEL